MATGVPHLDIDIELPAFYHAPMYLAGITGMLGRYAAMPCVDTFELMQLLSRGLYISYDGGPFERSFWYYQSINDDEIHPFEDVGRFYCLRSFYLSKWFYDKSILKDIYNPPKGSRDMPIVSLRKFCTFREVKRCYRKMLDCNVAELVAFNHDLYKPGGVEMLKLVTKYSL
jgi:hypothetical protein